MQGINFNQRSTSKTERIPQSHTWPWWIHVVWWASRLVPSGFSSPYVPGVCCSTFYTFFSLCLALSSRIKHNAFSREQLLPYPSLAGNHTWVSRTTRGRRLIFGGQPLLLHSMGRDQGWGHLRANLGFGVFWFILPLLSKPIFGQPPL